MLSMIDDCHINEFDINDLLRELELIDKLKTREIKYHYD